LGNSRDDRRNPDGVAELAARFPRVAEYSNPGLEDESPSGKIRKLYSTKRSWLDYQQPQDAPRA
jgi:hypothetical protein